MIIKIGTRGSQLALKQVDLVISAIKDNLECSVSVIETTGCKRQKTNSKVDDKKLWIKELEDALIQDRIDFAIHSAKDVPYDIDPDTEIFSILKRDNPCDVFISKTVTNIEELPKNSKIGTSSLRRASQLKNIFPDLDIVPIIGNINTRIDKIESSGLSGIILARAGLNRMSFNLGIDLDLNQFLPAVNQGIICVQIHKNKSELIKKLKEYQDLNTQIQFLTERKIITNLSADCRSSLGVYSFIEDKNIKIICKIYSTSGKISISEEITGKTEEWSELATQISQKLLDQGAKELLCGLE